MQGIALWVRQNASIQEKDRPFKFAINKITKDLTAQEMYLEMQKHLLQGLICQLKA